MTGTKDILPSLMLSLAQSTNDSILITTPHDLDAPGPRIVYANPAFLALSGYTLDEVLGRSPRFLQGPETDPAALSRIGAALRRGEACREDLLNYAKSGRTYRVDVNIVPLFGEDGSIQFFGAIQRDVTLKHNKAMEWRKLAREDILTGVANRTGLDSYLAELAAEVDPQQDNHLLLLDLDGFKAINDQFGHLAGDRVLQKFAALLADSLRRDDFIARLGGDEFVVILKGYHSHEARAVAHRIIRTVATAGFTDLDHLGVSIGIARFGSQEAMEDIIRRADAALYDAKHSGKGTVREFATLSGNV